MSTLIPVTQCLFSRVTLSGIEARRYFPGAVFVASLHKLSESPVGATLHAPPAAGARYRAIHGYLVAVLQRAAIFHPLPGGCLKATQDLSPKAATPSALQGMGRCGVINLPPPWEQWACSGNKGLQDRRFCRRSKGTRRGAGAVVSKL